MRESDLYEPIKRHFQNLGYVVKGEVGAADVMAVRGNEPAIIIELKLGFSLTLFHQATERLRISDHVYVAVVRPEGKFGYKRLKLNQNLCRRLGLGLLTLRVRDQFVELHCMPEQYNPRKSAKKSKQIMKLFERLDGDPNSGGATRHGLVTGYRQDALKCATFLAISGASRGAVVAKETGVESATSLMRNNVYGWFDKVEQGVYALNSTGKKGLTDWADVIN
ncbi:MAG: hypothetical protein ISQ85_01625 [Planktomarina sp.]|jgi:hypothetical protein|nr:DUF2161 family putative PD-(D/E)XK-type phosphodiesterase [Planktomarina sp.]MBL6845581.1 hypothetical protein [Planktomarina sp.]MDA9099893.1 DUF2161 family putative PD-(D/E)XK-type phosphodiesterase [Planktomarina sp.]MDC1249615.1 DUF2161 family putative PD-(D/E)XK-type phosphodiesterase [Planktomarina sp.]|tara:strand:- start:18478 stop:19143 length:666 start_codon:yes stop_codon:yes gene_type:complete